MHSSTCDDKVVDTKRFSTGLDLVFRVEHIAPVPLAVVVVVVQVLPPVAEAVLGATWREIFHIGVDGSHELLGSGGRTVLRAVKAVVCSLPNQRIEGFPFLPVRIQAILQPFDTALPSPEVQVHSGLGIGSPSVDRKRVVIHGRSVDWNPRPIDAVRINLGPFVSVISQHISANHDIPSAQLLAVEKPHVALLQTPIPILAFLSTSRMAVHAVLKADTRQWSRVRKSSPNVDDPTEGSASVEHGTRPLDHLNLFQIFKGQEPPCGTACIPAKDGQVVHEHHDAGASSVAETATAANLGFTIDHAHPRGLLNRRFKAGGGLVFDKGRLEYFKRDGHL